MAEHNPFEHVVDHDTLSVFGFYDVPLPRVSLPFGLEFQITRFMVMELIAAALVAACVIPLARHAARNRVTRGRFLNLFEAIVVFIRDGVARPAIGGHGADAFLPFLWTMFFFILFNNLLGLFPGGASPTGALSVTGALALLAFGCVVLAGVRAMGPVGFVVGIVPHMDVPKLIKPFLWGLMFVIEVAGLIIRHVVLSVRLFANMLAGHVVLAVILGFIAEAVGLLSFLVTPTSILGVVALSLLELFVAFLQAYIFTFLAALFIGQAVHPH